MVQICLMREWSMLHHLFSATYEIEGAYIKVAEESQDHGWQRSTVDIINAEIGATVHKHTTDKDGRRSTTVWRVTEEGLKLWENQEN